MEAVVRAVADAAALVAAVADAAAEEIAVRAGKVLTLMTNRALCAGGLSFVTSDPWSEFLHAKIVLLSANQIQQAVLIRKAA